jgi:hypothetical protein
MGVTRVVRVGPSKSNGRKTMESKNRVDKNRAEMYASED